MTPQITAEQFEETLRSQGDIIELMQSLPLAEHIEELIQRSPEYHKILQAGALFAETQVRNGANIAAVLHSNSFIAGFLAGWKMRATHKEIEELERMERIS